MGDKSHLREVMTAKEAAAFLRIPCRLLLTLVERHDVPGRKLGTEWRFLRAALVDWLAGKRDESQRLLRHAGRLAGDDTMDELLASIYANRGRPMVQDN